MDTAQLAQMVKDIRVAIVKMIAKAGSGHIGGSLGMADIFSALYFEVLNHDPKNPNWEERDRLILSNGHICPVLYATLAFSGYFPKKNLLTYATLGSDLQGHPERERLPGVETTSGPLGSGLAQAAGIALTARVDQKKFQTACITSDGEHDEGNHWEAVMFAAKYKLSNLTSIVDRNDIQIGGFTEDIMPISPLADKYRSFNWNVVEINGHDFDEILDAFKLANEEKTKPTVIVAHTTAGKGVSFMEGKWEWHDRVPNKKETKNALEELNSTR